MADNFDFNEVLGKLADCVANKRWYAVPDQLKKLAQHPENEDVRNTLLDTVDYMIEQGGTNYLLNTLDSLIDSTKNLKSIEGSYLQAKLVTKWESVCDQGAKDDADNTLSYLSSACANMTPDDPLQGKALPRWEALVDAQMPLTGFELDCTLSLSGEPKNADFRHAVLERLAKLKDTEPDAVLKLLLAGIERGNFYSYKDKDPESVRLLGTTIADIIDANQSKYDFEQLAETARKVFVHCEGCGAEAEEKAARIYLSVADRGWPDQFSRYSELLYRKNPNIAGVARDAAFRILDIADRGRPTPDDRDFDEVARCVYDRIFSEAVKPETKDDALAARAAETLMDIVRTDLAQPNPYSSYLAYNSAQMLYSYFEPGDPREAEVLKLWDDALTRTHKNPGDDYYARQTGWMLDSAAKKGDVALAARMKKEWRDTLENQAKRWPHDAHRTVQQIVVNAAHYAPDSALVAEARSMLPDLEAKAGIKRTPEKVGNDDFLKMIGKKRRDGFKP